MEKERLLYLIERVYDHQLSAAERKELIKALDKQDSNDLVQLHAELMLEHPVVSSNAYDDSHLQAMIGQITEIDRPSGEKLQFKSPRLYYLRKWRWIAASVLLVISIGTYLLFNKNSNTIQPVTASSGILPGKDGAILTLANGSKLLLDSMQNGVVALQGGATAKVENGKLFYETRGHEVLYNTMSTPKGRQFRLTLPDGTEVWLNSASSIHYPTVFNGTERQVAITGEVYFEVAKNKKMPFRVNVNQKALVEVLGTRFNVNGYENETSINTTLLEGTVRLFLSNNHSARRQAEGQSVLLKPGQMAQVRNNIEIVNNANIERVMAWKNGLFNFNNMDFDEAMRQLERWYDIEVVYEKGIPQNIELYGKITKGVTLDGLLNVLRDIGVRCRLEGRRLLIQQSTE